MKPPRGLAAHLTMMLSGLAACVPATPGDPGSTPFDGSGAGGAKAGGGSGGGGGASAPPGSGGASDPAGTGGRADGTGGATGTGGTVGTGGAPAGSSGGSSGGGGTGSGGASGGSGGAQGSTGGRGGAPAGTGGAGAGGAGAAGCPPGAFLCEGFEAYTAGAAPGGTWSRTVRSEGRINVETSRPFSGQKALHVTGEMNRDSANIRTPLAISASTVFVRFMMYTVGYPSSSGVHTRLIRLGTNAGTASGTPESSYSFASYNGTAIEKVNSIYLRNTQTKLNDAAVKNRWVCWEFEIDKTGGVGNVKPHIWLDGRELALAAAGSSSHGMTSPSWDPIPIETFIMGLDGFQPDEVLADFWIDDLVVDSRRVGCPAN